MSVIVFRQDDLKSLELACGDFTQVPAGLFAELHVANMKAGAATRDDREIGEAEAASLRADYNACEMSRRYGHVSGQQVLDALSSLTYNLSDNGGEVHLSPAHELLRRRLVQGVVFELLIPGGPSVRLDEYAHVRRLAARHDHVDCYQILSGETEQEAYVFPVSGRTCTLHGKVFPDKPWLAFEAAWIMHDLCALDAEERYRAALYAQAARLGIVPAQNTGQIGHAQA